MASSQVGTKLERITQSNDLARAAQDLDLNEKRLILYTIAQIKRGDKELLRHRFYLSDLARIYGTNRHDIYKLANDITTSLLRRVIYIETGQGWKKFQWTTLAEYVDGASSKNGAYVDVRLNQELEPYLIELSERFNSIPLNEALDIPSFNSLRLFELLWHDSHAGHNTVVEYLLDDLKVRLGLREIRGKWEKYKSFKDFRTVLDKAQEDMAEFTSLRMSYKPVRSGRKYTRLRFIIERSAPATGKPKSLPTLEPTQLAEHQLLARELEAAGFTQNPFDTIERYGPEVVTRVLKKARAAERRANFTKSPIQNLGGLITWMLRSGVGEGADEEAEAKVGDGTLSESDVTTYAEALRDAYAAARAEHLETHWQTLKSEEQIELHDIMKVVLDRHTLSLLGKADWRGLIYETARDRALIIQGLVELPEDLNSIAGYLEKHFTFDVSEHERERITSATIALEGGENTY